MKIYLCSDIPENDRVRVMAILRFLYGKDADIRYTDSGRWMDSDKKERDSYRRSVFFDISMSDLFVRILDSKTLDRCSDLELATARCFCESIICIGDLTEMIIRKLERDYREEL